MIVLGRVYRSLRRHIRQVSWGVLFATLLLHMLGTWALLALAGESKLVGLDAWFYYYMTTATTIGYGDLSPSTVPGRYVVALFLMPGAVGLFAAMIAKTSSSLLLYWQRHLKGKMSYETMKGHTVLVGWGGTDTARLVQLLLADTSTDDEGIVLVAAGISENPMPEELRFVSTAAYSDRTAYARAGVAAAARVIIVTPNDDQTLAAVLAVKSHHPAGHVVAHFQESAAASLVKSLHPEVECTRPMMAEVIARAAQDPGSSLLTIDLLSCADGNSALFSVPAPLDGAFRSAAPPRALGSHGASLIGFKPIGAAAPTVDPAFDGAIPAGAALYYLAAARLTVADLFTSNMEQAA